MKTFLTTCLGIILSCAVSYAQITQLNESVTSDDKIIAVVYDREIHMSQKDNLVGIIFGALLAQYAKDHNIEPTKEEIELFIFKSKEQQNKNQQEWEQERNQILNKLKQEDISESERHQLTGQLEMLNNILEAQPELEKYRQENQEEVRKMEEGIAKQFITSEIALE